MKRTYVRITLALDSAWRIGDWQPDDANSLATLRDPASPDHVWIPGSSIAGSLRRAGADPVALFGSEPPQSKSDETKISPWWILGISFQGEPQAELRQRTAIDRHRRAAAKQGLFDAEEVRVSEGTSTAMLYLRSDELDHSGLKSWIERWQPRIGGGRSVGMGRARVAAMAYRTFDLANDDDVTALLKASGKGPERVDALLASVNETPIKPSAVDPWLTVALKVAHMAVSRANEDCTEGSTIKGLLRSRVEFIGRSLGYIVCRGMEGDPWTGDECDVCQAFGSTKQPGVLEFESARWQGPTDTSLQTVQRIAIDRFTGGALNSALWPQSYQPDIRMELRIHKTDGLLPWVEAALFQSLRDLDDHLCTIGPEGAVGFGFAEVGTITVDKTARTLADLCTPVPLPEATA